MRKWVGWIQIILSIITSFLALRIQTDYETFVGIIFALTTLKISLWFISAMFILQGILNIKKKE